MTQPPAPAPTAAPKPAAKPARAAGIDPAKIDLTNLAQVDWSRVDWSRLAASDIGYSLGPAMTEEQFAEYRRRAGGRVQVLKSPAPGGPGPRTRP
jgi:hypothetical protein